MPVKKERDVAPIRAKCSFQEEKKKNKKVLDSVQELKSDLDVEYCFTQKVAHYVSRLDACCENFLPLVSNPTQWCVLCHSTVLLVVMWLWNGWYGHTLRPHGICSWRCSHSGGSSTYLFRYLQTCSVVLHLIINIVLYSISSDFKNSVRYLNMQNMDQQLVWLIEKKKRFKEKLGVQLFKCWIILQHIFANVFVSNFRNVCLVLKGTVVTCCSSKILCVMYSI